MSASLLIEEPPLQVLPGLACRIGLNEAIFIQQLHYWMKKSKNFDEQGRRYVWNSLPEWQVQLPFWSLNTIQRIVRNLELPTAGRPPLIISWAGEGMDKKKRYSIDYEAFEALVMEKSTTITPSWGDDDPKLGSSREHYDESESTTEILSSTVAPSGLVAAAPVDVLNFGSPPKPPKKGKTKPSPARSKPKEEDPGYVEARAGVRAVFLSVRGYELTNQTRGATLAENDGVKCLAQMILAGHVALSQIEAYLRYQRNDPYWQKSEILASVVSKNLRAWLASPDGMAATRPANGSGAPGRKAPVWDEEAWQRQQEEWRERCSPEGRAAREKRARELREERITQMEKVASPWLRGVLEKARRNLDATP